MPALGARLRQEGHDLLSSYIIRPDPLDPRLSQEVEAIDQTGAKIKTRVVVERPLTLYLNAQEIVTMMTIGDHPDYLALGYLLNQLMLTPEDDITGVDFDEELDVVVVRTEGRTNFEEKLKKRTLTSGCAQGTTFGDLMEAIDRAQLPATPLRTSWLYRLQHIINQTPSLYLEAGAIHGCVLCEEDRPLVYMEDVGRHNAVDKIAGWMLQTRCDPPVQRRGSPGHLDARQAPLRHHRQHPVLAWCKRGIRTHDTRRVRPLLYPTELACCGYCPILRGTRDHDCCQVKARQPDAEPGPLRKTRTKTS